MVVVPDLDEILDFCAREPVERVLLEDVARRRLGRFVGLRDGGSLTAICHVGANVVPSGEGCGARTGRRSAGGRAAGSTPCSSGRRTPRRFACTKRSGCDAH